MPPETEDQYQKINESLFTRYENETGHSWRENPLEFVLWLDPQRQKWTKKHGTNTAPPSDGT